MSILDILKFPDERLRTVAKPITDINEEIKNIAKDMIETMYATRGVGLAGTQVNVHQRIVVMDVSEAADTPVVMINPEITWLSEDHTLSDEGCLSIPGLYGKVKRSKQASFKYLDLDGVEHTVTEADGLLAYCIQHEIDHINGVVFYDRLSSLKKKMADKKLKKIFSQKKASN